MGKGRSPCCDKSKVKRGPWSPAEDLKLITFIQNHGHANWRSLPAQAGLLRCGKSCRLRWINYLRPDLKRGNITPEEEETIIKLHETHGNKWSKIASFFPGRTDNEIKNIWNTHIAKKLGIKYVRKHASKRKKSKKSSQDPFSSPSRSSLLQNDDMDRDSKVTTSLGNIKVREKTTLGETQGCRATLRDYEEEQGESPTPSLISCISNVLTSQEHDHGQMDKSFDMSLEAMDVVGSRASDDQTSQKLHDFDETDFWNALELDNLCPLQCIEFDKNTSMPNACEDSSSSGFENKDPNTSNVEPYSWIRYLEIELGLDA